MRSGDVDVTIGRLWSLGINGYDWSFTASSRHIDSRAIPSVYYLRFDTTDANSSNGPFYRWYSFPLRGLGIRGGSRANDTSGHLNGQCQWG